MEELVRFSTDSQMLSSRKIAEITEKRHAHVIRDIQVLIDKKAIDLISNLNPNLGSTQNEPICIESQYLGSNGKPNPEYRLNEYAAQVLAASYDPVIARKLIKFIQQLNNPEMVMARALLMAKSTIDTQQRSLEIANKQLEAQAPVVQYANKVLMSTSCHTPTTIASELNMSAITLNKLLVKARFFRKTGTKGEYGIYANYQGMGYVESNTHSYVRKDGTTGTKISYEFTERGRRKVHEIFNRAVNAGVLKEKKGRYFINHEWEPVTTYRDVRN